MKYMVVRGMMGKERKERKCAGCGGIEGRGGGAKLKVGGHSEKGALSLKKRALPTTPLPPQLLPHRMDTHT